MEGYIPDFFGCVRRDARLCRMTELLGRECFFAMTDCICMSFACEGDEGGCAEDAALLFLECFCLLGRLTVALGGNPLPGTWHKRSASPARARQRGTPHERIEAHKRSLSEHCRRVMRWSHDGVVRAALSLLAEKTEEDQTVQKEENV